MAITFVAAAGQNFNAASFTADIPAGTADGDLLLFFATTDSNHNSTGTLPSGVDKIGEQDVGTDTTMSVFRKIAASEGSQITFTNIFDASESGRVITLAYRGVDQTTPMDTAAVFGSESGTAWDTGAITTVTNDAWLVAGFGADPGSDPYTFTWDSPINERIDSDTTPTGQNGTLAYMAIGDRVVTTAGTPTTLGGDASVSDTPATVVVALRPAATSTFRTSVMII